MHKRRSYPPVRCLLASVTVAFLTVGAVACGSDDSSSDDSSTTTTTTTTVGDTTTPTSGDGGGDELVVVAKDFSLTNLTVAPGEAFVLDNQDGATHTLTADAGEFDSDEVPGGTRSDPLTAPDAPGDYPFHCEIHASMTGTLSVAA